MPKFETGKPKTGGRKAGTANAITGEVRALAHRLLNSPTYRKAFRARLEAGQLAPALETMLWSYAYGRPPAEAPEPVAPIPVDPLRALAVKLLRLEGDEFRMALAGLFAHEVSTAPPKALPEALPEGPPMLDDFKPWIARARALCEQSAQHPEPPTLARHLAAELAAELPVEALLDTAKAHGGDVLVNVLDALVPHPPAAHGGFLERGDLPVLDEATAAALAPLVEAAQLLAALSKLTGVPV